MTAVTTGRARFRAREDLPRAPNWDRIAVILAVLLHLSAAIWFASALDRRVRALEDQLPAGSIQRLDQHVVDLDANISRLQAARP